LTHHFWDDEQKLEFRAEEYNEKRDHSLILISLFKKSDFDTPALDKLSHKHIQSLAGALAVCSSQFILNRSPSSLLKKWIIEYCHDIMIDDLLLLSSESSNLFKNLTTEEIEVICLRRGVYIRNRKQPIQHRNYQVQPLHLQQTPYDPTDDEGAIRAELASCLDKWLSFSSGQLQAHNITDATYKTFLKENISADVVSKYAFAMALPEKYYYNKEFQFHIRV